MSEAADLRPWGYAIGNYMRPAGCAACGCDLWQVDKYADRCCPCAYAAREKHIAEQAAMPVEKATARPTDDEAIRAFAVSMALELDVNVDRAEKAVRNLITRGLMERSADSDPIRRAAQ